MIALITPVVWISGTFVAVNAAMHLGANSPALEWLKWLVPCLVAAAAAAGFAQFGLRRNWHTRRILICGWSIAALGVVTVVPVAVLTFLKAGRVSAEKAVQADLYKISAAADQFIEESGRYRIFLTRDDAAFWLFLVQCEQGRKEAAVAELARTKQSGWTKSSRKFARFLTGHLTEGELNAYAGSHREDDTLFCASLARTLQEKIAVLTTELASIRQTLAARAAAVKEARARAEEKLNAGDYTGAVAVLNPIIERGPDMLLLRLRADARRGLGDLAGALGDYTLAMEQFPTDRFVNSIIQYTRGHVRRLLGDLPAAAADFRPLARNDYISTRFNCTDASYWLYLIECELGHKDAATAELEARLSRQGRNPWRDMDRRLAEFLLGRVSEAQLDAVASKSSDPTWTLKASFYSAMLRRRAGDSTGALDRFRQFLASRLVTRSRDFEFEATEARRAVSALELQGKP